MTCTVLNGMITGVEVYGVKKKFCISEVSVDFIGFVISSLSILSFIILVVEKEMSYLVNGHKNVFVCTCCCTSFIAFPFFVNFVFYCLGG